MDLEDTNELFEDIILRNFDTGKDVLYTEETIENHQSILEALSKYILCFMTKRTNTIDLNNKKVKMEKISGFEDGSLRDQGFTRPKILVILPLKNTAFDLINKIQRISGLDLKNKKRFQNEFGSEVTPNLNKPKDYKYIFRDNNEDCFKIGLNFSNTKIECFSNMYRSDVIVASPLGLKLFSAEKKENESLDFLSSIELLVVDQLDVISMQNMSHLNFIIKAINKIPKSMHDSDISRIKQYFLDGNGSDERQTIIFCQYLTPEINSICNNLTNIKGKISPTPCNISGLVNEKRFRSKFLFRFFESVSPEDSVEKRLDFFIKNVVEAFDNCELEKVHTCIFVSSYFEFVRVKRYFENRNAIFDVLCEYTDNPTITGVRASFIAGRFDFLIITERFQFFKRYNIKGIKKLIFYSLPENPIIFAEVIDMMESYIIHKLRVKIEYPVVCIVDKFDYLKLKRIIGSSKTRSILSSPDSSFIL